MISAASASDPDLAPHVAAPADPLRALVSRYTGVVHSCEPVGGRPEDGGVVVVEAALAAAQAILGLPEVAGAIRGVRHDTPAALRSALGEAAERYALSWVDTREIVRGSARELAGRAIDPDEFVLFHETQYHSGRLPYQPFTRETVVNWTPATRLRDGASVLVPVDLVWWLTTLGPPVIDSPTTNGMACHDTMEEAVIRGILELLERDAFMLTWYNRLSLPLIDVSSVPGLGQAGLRRQLPFRGTLRLVDLSAFHGLPTVVAVVRTPPPHPYRVTVGASSGRALVDACSKAVSEACGARAWMHSHSFTIPGTPWDISLVQEHAMYYARPERSSRLDFLDAAAERHVPEYQALPRDRGAALDALVTRVARAGSETYLLDLTPPDIRAAGLFVVKVICPGLQPLDSTYAGRHFGGSRLLNAAYEVGLRDRPLRHEDLNGDPHPFP